MENLSICLDKDYLENRGWGIIWFFSMELRDVFRGILAWK